MASEDTPLPRVWVACIPLLALLGSMAVSILVLGQDPHIPLIFSAVVAALVGRIQGYSWQQLEAGMLGGVQIGLKAILILVIIGVLIALWIAGGVVPYLIYLGLELMSPAVFLPATCLICAVVSLSTGSSWTTAGTVGVALMGVGSGLGMPLPMVAGAVVSGAYFGDKMSPLSDSTNLAAAVTGVDLFSHIRHMMYTTVPAFVIALLLYALSHFFMTTEAVSGAVVRSIQTALQQHYTLHPVLLLAPLVVVVLSLRKVSAIPVLIAASAVGLVFAMSMQEVSMEALVGYAHFGYESLSGHDEVDALLSRGGLDSMMYAVSLILCALAFGGIMERSRMIESIAAVVLKRVQSDGALVTTTVGTCLGLNVTAPDQYLAIVVPGRMYGQAYADRGLQAKNLSRTVEDAGTLTSPLVPWNTCGVTMMVALSVSPFAFLPYAFFNLLTPMVAILWAFWGIGQARIREAEGASST